MSSNTWTPEELSSSAAPFSGKCWRVVEAQHLVSTTKLTDTAAEQTIIENLIEESKPAIPPECRHLNYLLYTPFRYSPYPQGSRFRRANSPVGVFYSSEEPATAVAEKAFYRLLFFAESPATPWPSNPGQYTVFKVAITADMALDLTKSLLNTDHRFWTDLSDYTKCQELADAARAEDIDVIRYQSVRDPNRKANLAILRCRAFAQHKPTAQQTWRFHFDASGVRAICEAPGETLSFVRETFAADPRMADFNWERG